MNRNKIPPSLSKGLGELSEQVDAGAKALREHQMSGRITRSWDQIPDSDKFKWQQAAMVVLRAAATVK